MPEIGSRVSGFGFRVPGGNHDVIRELDFGEKGTGSERGVRHEADARGFQRAQQRRPCPVEGDLYEQSASGK